VGALFLISALILASTSDASLPTNGVLRTNLALNSLLNSGDAESPYYRCLSQGTSALYFSNSCAKLFDALRKKMNMMALEADLQMQAEKLSPHPLSKVANDRISLLSKINLLSTQAQETLKASESKEDLPDIVDSVKRVQSVVTSYSELLPHGAS
jgi:hypothetical protein